MHWIIYALDKPDGADLRRQTRAEHLAYIQAQTHVTVVLAGPLLEDEGEGMTGSLFVQGIDDPVHGRLLYPNRLFLPWGLAFCKPHPIYAP